MTDLGSWAASLGAALGLWTGGRRREGLDALGAASATWGLAQLLKAAVLRPRPYHTLQEFRVLITRPSSSAWPSAHPAVLLAFVTVASRDLGATKGVKASLVALAAAVGVSRVYLGVHYPADVAGGLLLGRGVADLWSSAVSPKAIKRLPAVAVPLE
jgi:membrane-associated phospholipid phosphatase